MQLLVSVRSEAEVEPALAGGADIIDAKEPDQGPLGPVTAAALAGILARVPPGEPFSVALGDIATVRALGAALAALELPPRTGPTFLKLGFAGLAAPERVGAILAAAVARASASPSPLRVVAVAYGDAERAASLSPEIICRLAHTCGAAGVLMDTCVKDGSRLLDWWRPDALARWVSEARTRGLLTGLAGALGPHDVSKLLTPWPDVLGFRSAACLGGRGGAVSSGRVSLLRQRIYAVQSGSLGTLAYPAPGHRETRYGMAHSGVVTDANSLEIND